MEPNTLTYIIGGVALVLGVVAGKFVFAANTKQKIDEANAQAQSLLKEAEMRAETIKKEKELEAKVVLMGFGLDSDNLHSPNEKFDIANFYKGIETIPYFHKYFSE